MAQRWLKVEFQSPWHVGTGRGGGADIDARVRRSPGGLPIVPGRTLKGVLRQATELADQLRLHSPSATAWFGTGLPDGTEMDLALEKARFLTEPGSVFVTSAQLGRDHSERAQWEQLGAAQGEVVQGFFMELHQTALDETGIARASSLRTVEAVVPLVLWAQLEGPLEALDGLEEVLPLVTAIGTGRRRGLGRVSLSMEA